MPGSILTAGLVWMLLIAAVIFLALGRISAAVSDEKLTRAGLCGTNPLHARLRRVIETEDRIGIALTVAVAIFSAVLAFALAVEVTRNAIERVLRIG